MGFPTPTGVRWGLLLGLAGGMLLQLAPFLPLARVPLLGLQLPVPSLFLHGGGLLALGTLAVLLAVLRRPWPGVRLLLGAGALALLAWDARLVLARTPGVLGRAQLSLAGLNSWLASLGVEPLELVPRGGHADLGPGLWVGLAGAALLVAGSGLEALGLASEGRTLPSVLLGLPRCRACGQRVELSMAFCPGCGAARRRGEGCPGCGGWMREGDRFCSACGTPRTYPARRKPAPPGGTGAPVPVDTPRQGW